MIDYGKEFKPDWASPPGETIAEFIEERNWKQKELAARLDISDKHLNQLIKGKVALTPDMARRLALVLGPTEDFWIKMEAIYREQLRNLESQKIYEQYIGWLDKFPLNDLKKADILTDLRTSKSLKPVFVRQLLRFFAVSSPEQWESQYVQLQGNFRRANNDNSNIGAITAWLRQGEILAERLGGELTGRNQTVRFSKSKFEKQLQAIRQLTTQNLSEISEQLKERFLSAGVMLAFVPSIPKAHVSGVARWLSPGRPLIQLSLYGKFNDKFWFTLYHKSAHLLLHSDDKNIIFLDNANQSEGETEHEREANSWAENILIPQRYTPELFHLQTVYDVEKFASKIDIHPGIVVGRLQKENVISFDKMNGLKVSYEISKNE